MHESWPSNPTQIPIQVVVHPLFGLLQIPPTPFFALSLNYYSFIHSHFISFHFISLVTHNYFYLFLLLLPLFSLFHSFCVLSFDWERKMDDSGDRFPIGMRVLAVDDDPTCLLVLETLLRRCQYHGQIRIYCVIIFIQVFIFMLNLCL